MTEPTPVVPAVVPAAPEPPAAPPAAPPWGDDFDAQKAWNLVENLKADKARLAARPVLTDEQKTQLGQYTALLEASKTEAQRQAEATQAAQRDAELARAEAIRYKAAATHGISADHFDLLGSGTEEEISARAEKIAALVASTAAPVAPPPVVPGSGRPVEQLRPGATPAGAVNEDEAIYQALFGPGK